MTVDILIVGQGISGTFLSWYLEKAGISHVVLDDDRPGTPSRSAAGLINPVTGRRIVKTWMIDELLAFADIAYDEIGAALQVESMRPVSVVDFFPTPQMRLAFLERLAEDPQYLHLPDDEHDWDESFNYGMGYGSIAPCYLVNLPELLPAARRRLRQKGLLREERFERQELKMEQQIEYKDITADRIIFCDGMESSGHPLFTRLPFAPNKGEALILDIPTLPTTGNVFKKTMTLAPWRDGLFWVGSSYEWSFTDRGPTETFRQRTTAVLQEWLKHPFTIVDHIASVRPATLERRPFVGFHPLHPNVGILNGMGTKGCSLAPYFAHQLMEHITGGKPLRPDADVKRFEKILSR